MTKIMLLPCPFCGGEAEFGESSSPSQHFVNCTECLTTTNILTETGYDEAEAAKAWNRRTHQSYSTDLPINQS